VWDFGDLRVEPHRHVASIASEVLDLSLREFQLLVELAREHGRVVAKGVLAQRLNPLGDPLETGAVEVHVSNLRRKIGARRICTVRGVGYMLTT
jgi:two-component system response regulator BasR